MLIGVSCQTFTAERFFRVIVSRDLQRPTEGVVMIIAAVILVTIAILFVGIGWPAGLPFEIAGTGFLLFITLAGIMLKYKPPKD